MKRTTGNNQIFKKVESKLTLAPGIFNAISAVHQEMKTKLKKINASPIGGYAAVITAAACWGASGVFVKLRLQSFMPIFILNERLTMSQATATVVVVAGVLQLLQKNQRRIVMSPRSEELTQRFTAFNNEVISFVENCPEKDWNKVCAGENWPVGVVARHVAASHYRALALAQMIVDGKPLPDLSHAAIDEANAKHAEKHAGCTKDEVLGLLRENGSAISGYLAGLDDADLDRTGNLALAGGAISTQQVIDNIIIQSASEHLASLKAATGR